MKTYSLDELKVLLAAVDANLIESVKMLVIGGAAVALGYGIDLVTRDIDTWGEIPPALKTAFEKAREVSGLDIPVNHAAVADAPYDFETRLESLDLGNLRKLHVLVPEKHDLALMKVLRGYEHDLQMVQRISEKHGLDFEILTDRYLREMGQAIGDPRTLNLKILAAVERLFDENSVRKLETRLER
jgi:hypothetical protein